VIALLAGNFLPVEGALLTGVPLLLWRALLSKHARFGNMFFSIAMTFKQFDRGRIVARFGKSHDPCDKWRDWIWRLMSAPPSQVAPIAVGKLILKVLGPEHCAHSLQACGVLSDRCLKDSLWRLLRLPGYFSMLAGPAVIASCRKGVGAQRVLVWPRYFVCSTTTQQVCDLGTSTNYAENVNRSPAVIQEQRV